MTYSEAAKFKVRVGVCVLDAKNRLLLSRQNKRPYWVLPGGTLEAGETLAECAVREIQEEAGLAIELGQLLFVSDFFASNGQQVVDVIFLGHLKGGVLTPETTENIDEIDFFTLEQVVNLTVKPEPVFERIIDAWETGVWPQGVYWGKLL